MNRYTFLYILLLISIGLNGCSGSNENDWAGIYTGTIPAADGHGINVHITLNSDYSYTLIYDYIGKESIYKEVGVFDRYKPKNYIILQNSLFPRFYKIKEGNILQLDMEGNEIAGEFADMYVLVKK